MSRDVTIVVSSEPPELAAAPTYRIEAVCRDQSGAVVFDRTGDNALVWPGCLAELSPRDRRDFMEAAARGLVSMMADSAARRPPTPPPSGETAGSGGAGGV